MVAVRDGHNPGEAGLPVRWIRYVQMAGVKQPRFAQGRIPTLSRMRVSVRSGKQPLRRYSSHKGTKAKARRTAAARTRILDWTATPDVNWISLSRSTGSSDASGPIPQLVLT